MLNDGDENKNENKISVSDPHGHISEIPLVSDHQKTSVGPYTWEISRPFPCTFFLSLFPCASFIHFFLFFFHVSFFSFLVFFVFPFFILRVQFVLLFLSTSP